MAQNIYGPDDLRALQTAYDRVWSLMGPTYSLSRNDVAQLIFSLAADGGAKDRDEIDVAKLVREALERVTACVQRGKQRDAWSVYPRQTASRVWLLNDNLKSSVLLH